ncbi:MAG: sugar phosphate isomerase/epimerase [Caldilineaceae bacterium]|nr:sugar phosphate isomerase/epimerase [Caldilineaceae bacterium]HRJ43220.1 sugar phosphate isomerase/epimerase family protein [Caldilineaceae bacterium]
MYPNLSTGAIGVQATFGEAVELAARYGFGGVDFSIVEVEKIVQAQGEAAVGKLLNDAGVRLGSWGPPVNWRTDEASWQADLPLLGRRARLARALGSDRSSTWIMPGENDRDFAANYAFHLERLGPVAEGLAAEGCRLGLEWVGPKTLRDSRRYPFIHTMEGMLKLAADLGTGNVGLLVDLFHLYTSNASVSAVHSLPVAQVVNVHVNDAIAGRSPEQQLDNERALPAETGVTDIAGFLQALAAIGYDGPVTVEPFSQRLREMTPADAVQTTADSLRRAWALAGIPFPG